MIPPEKKKSGQRKNDHVPYFEYGGCEGNFRIWQFALGESLYIVLPINQYDWSNIMAKGQTSDI